MARVSNSALRSGLLIGVFSTVVAGGAPAARAGLLDSLKGLLAPAPAEQDRRPSVSEVDRGLLEALRVGAERAVGRASAAGGFLDNPRIRIRLPPAIEKVGSALRSVGLGSQVDEFETTLNRGAEKAAAKALPIFGDAIGKLTFQDVERIWKGGESAATQYFREKTQTALFDAFVPVVHAATQEVGVTRAYRALTANPIARLAGSGTDLDLDHYVTNNALDGLFTLLADEEREIRTNPMARTTELLRKVFSPP